MDNRIGLAAVLDMTNFTGNMTKYMGSVDSMTGKTESVASKMSSLGSVMGTVAKVGVGAAIGAFATLGGIIASSIGDASEAQQAQAQLEAVLKSTGGAAGVTAEMAGKLASELQSTTMFSDEAALAAESLLLGFKNISKEAFPQAISLSADLATRLGMDLPSASKLLGKALETPGEGLLRLKQAGVAFTDEQEEMIKKMVDAGDAAGAQKYILDELSKSVGGAAKAAGETFAGKMTILKNKISDVKEGIGTAFLPILTQLADKFSQFITEHGPQITAMFQTMADWLMTNIPIAIQTVSDFWTNTLMPALQNTWNFIQTYIIPIFQTVASWFSGEGSSAVSSFADKITSILGPVIAFAQSLFQTLVTWVQTNWPLIQQTVQTVMTAIYTVVSTVLGAIKVFWDEHGAAIMAVIGNAFTYVKTFIETTINTVLGIIQAIMQVINGDWSGAWETIKGVAVGIWESIKGVISLAIDSIKQIISVVGPTLKSIWDGIWKALKDGATNAWAGISGAVSGWVTTFVGKFTGLKDQIVGIGASIVNGIKEGISNAWDTFIDWILGKMGSIIQAIADFLGIGSPAKATMPIGEAMVAGIQAGWNKQLAKLGMSIPGLPGMNMRTMIPAASSTVNNSSSIGGDTITVYVQNANQWAAVQSWVDSRHREKLGRGM